MAKLVFITHKYAITLTHNRNLKPSVEVQTHWKTTHQFNYSSLYKITKDVKRVQIAELEKVGSAKFYERKFNDVSPTRRAGVDRSFLKKNLFYTIRPTVDPLLISHAKKKTGNVFLSSKALAMIMSCCRSVQSWDLSFVKRNGMIFVDHRIPSRVTQITVDETSRNTPNLAEKNKHRPNSAYMLQRERTLLNYCFSQQVLSQKKKPVEYSKKLPFNFSPNALKTRSLPSRAYFYRLFTLSNDLKVVVRCGIDSVTTQSSYSGKENIVPTINRAVHEYMLKKEGRWEKLLESSPGTIIINEVNHNSFEFSRWIFEALLADAKYLNLGFCTRKNLKHDKEHEIMYIETVETKKFANQFNVKLTNGWAIFEKIIMAVLDLNDGNYTLLKIPNKQYLCVYQTNLKSKKVMDVKVDIGLKKEEDKKDLGGQKSPKEGEGEEKK